jgi:single-strand DNA-binding protein
MFVGRLTADPELNEYGGTSKVEFSIAVSDIRKDKEGNKIEEVDFFNCFAWASGAEAIAKYFKKGDLIMVHCKAKQDRWEDRETGKKRTAINYRVNEFEFLPYNSPDKKGESNETATSAATSSSGGGASDDDDIPF